MNVQEDFYQVNVGKNGLTQNTLIEIERELKNKKKVKVKFLRSHIDKEDRKSSTEKIINTLKEKVKFEKKLIGNTLFLKKK